jgi:hypothetical protein
MTRLGLTAALAAAVAVLAATDPPHAQACQRTGQFAGEWARLDAARAYRSGFAEPDDGGITRKRGNKSYNQLLQDYPPQQSEFGAVLDAFGAQLDDARPSVVREAVCGFRETLSEIMAGETLLGNQRLLQGLRTRYPGIGDPLDPDQLTLLTQSNAIFRSAVELAAERIRQDPTRLRSSGTVNLNFPFFVENTPRTTGTQGEVVESDFFRFTDLVIRYGLAGNSLGKRTFFLGNDTRAERDNAAATLQRTAQTVYLSAALLGAAQSRRDFQTNNGAEVKRQVNDAQQTFDDIRGGFNPLKLRGDFVPNQPTNNLLAGVRNLVISAQTGENSARTLNRQYDEDQTALTRELRDQTIDFIDQLDILISTVIRPGDASCNPPEQTNCDMTKPEDRDTILALTRNPVFLCGPQAALDPLDCRATADEGGCDATICTNYQTYTGAVIELREAERALFNYTEQIRIEEERSGALARTIRNGANAVTALDIAQGIAVSASPDIGTDGVLTFSSSAATEGFFNAGRTQIEGAQSIALEQNDSAATIKNLLLEEATQAIAVERAKLAVSEAHRNYTASIGDLVRFIRNAAGTREELAQAYFTNPAYRLQLELAQQDADASFQAAMVASYEATKALEYEWSERLANPVARQDGGLAEPIGGGSKFDPIVRAESAFAVASAGSPGSPSPTLQTYVEALQQWDIKMRQLRGPQRQPGQTVRISLKKDILGYDSPDEAFNRLAFRDYIAKSRRPGRNPDVTDLLIEFPMQIGDQTLLPARPNLKVFNPSVTSFCQGGLSVNLKTVPGRDLRTTASTDPPLVDLVMSDQAVVRTFFSRFDSGGDDDFLILKLEGARDLGQSQFAALSIQATIDGQGQVAPNCQLANRSPAVSRWQLRIQGDNRVNNTLDLDNLDDLEILLTYTFGQPQTFQFPSFQQ